jgi:hypothetical protein
MTPEQCRAARAMINWSQSVLSDMAGIPLANVVDFEENRSISDDAIADMRAAFERVGVEFTRDNAVRDLDDV